MNRSKLALLLLSATLLLGCSGRNVSPILIERGVQQYEREYLVTQEGFGIDNRLKKIFVQGYLEEGMTQEMVNMLWGPPDREFEDGITWEYCTKDGSLISRVKFKKSDLPRLGNYEMVVSSIEGDRYGGSPSPEANPSGSSKRSQSE